MTTRHLYTAPRADQVRVLVISPHRDDEAIGCGGALIRHADLGHYTAVAHVFTQRNAGEQEAVAAARILGVQALYSLEGPPLALETTEQHLIFVIRAIRTVRPDFLYMPHEAEADPSHRVAATLTLEARWISAMDLYPEAGPPVPPGTIKHLLAYEVWTPMERPAITCDISGEARVKRRAIKAYKSQLEAIKWDRASLGLNAYRAEKKGVNGFAEAFSPIYAPWPGMNGC